MKNKENKIVSSVAWGLGVLACFFAVERLCETGIKIYKNKLEDQEDLDIVEIESETEESL